MTGWEVIETSGADRIHAQFEGVEDAIGYLTARVVRWRESGWHVTKFVERPLPQVLLSRGKKERVFLEVKRHVT